MTSMCGSQCDESKRVKRDTAVRTAYRVRKGTGQFYPLEERIKGLGFSLVALVGVMKAEDLSSEKARLVDVAATRSLNMLFL